LISNTIGIKGKAPFPGGALSNLAAHEFVLDGVHCGSMEGLLQSLKVKDPEAQVQMCALSGGEARGRGQRHIWNVDGFLYWRGEPIDRLSEAYQVLLDRAYEALFAQNAKFRPRSQRAAIASSHTRSARTIRQRQSSLAKNSSRGSCGCALPFETARWVRVRRTKSHRIVES
jgi:hypothetical protein